jgi:hypothetical protein
MSLPPSTISVTQTGSDTATPVPNPGSFQVGYSTLASRKCKVRGASACCSWSWLWSISPSSTLVDKNRVLHVHRIIWPFIFSLYHHWIPTCLHVAKVLYQGCFVPWSPTYHASAKAFWVCFLTRCLPYRYSITYTRPHLLLTDQAFSPTQIYYLILILLVVWFFILSLRSNLTLVAILLSSSL